MIVIKDTWSPGFLSVTNAAEQVIRDMVIHCDLMNEQRVIYQDTEGTFDELLHTDGEFTGFNILNWSEQALGLNTVFDE